MGLWKVNELFFLKYFFSGGGSSCAPLWVTALAPLLLLGKFEWRKDSRDKVRKFYIAGDEFLAFIWNHRKVTENLDTQRTVQILSNSLN